MNPATLRTTSSKPGIARSVFSAARSAGCSQARDEIWGRAVGIVQSLLEGGVLRDTTVAAGKCQGGTSHRRLSVNGSRPASGRRNFPEAGRRPRNRELTSGAFRAPTLHETHAPD